MWVSVTNMYQQKFFKRLQYTDSLIGWCIMSLSNITPAVTLLQVMWA